MKRELTLTDIAGYLEHPLLGEHPSGAICWIDVEFVAKYGIALAGYKPVLRPMSDLYKEITDKDYNNGKPFVPIVELAKARHPNFNQYIFYDTELFVFYSMHSECGDYSECYDYYEDRLSIAELDLLHRLHFDYRGLIDAGLAVSVHDLPTNPYEA
jgi:hypothetical protein